MGKNRILSAVLALSFGAVALAASPSTAYAATGDGWAGLANLNSGMVMTPKGNSTANGAYIVQMPAPLSGDFPAIQNWQRVSVGGGYYTYINRSSGKALGVDGALTTPGAGIIQATRSDASPNQNWSFPATNAAGGLSGFAMIKNRKSGKCIGVSQASAASGATIAQYDCNANAKNQAWKMLDF